jgi:hypothetical protein
MNLITVIKRVYLNRFYWISENQDDIQKAFHRLEVWGQNATTDSDNGLQKLYAKLHANPWFPLLLPLIFIFLSFKATQFSDQDWIADQVRKATNSKQEPEDEY